MKTTFLFFLFSLALRASEVAQVSDRNAAGDALNERGGLLFYFSLGLFGVAIFIIANTLFTSEEEFKTTEKLDDADSKKEKKQEKGIILKYSRPFFKRYFSPIVGAMKNKKTIKERYRRKLASSGLTDDITPEDFFAFKLFLILAFPVLFFLVRQFGEFYDWPLMLAPAMGVVGFFYPDLWVMGLIEQRKQDIIRGFPFVVDLLALSVEAGLDFMAAMNKVVIKAPPGPIVDEFEIILRETKLGASRAEALRNFVWRADMIEVSSFAATLIAADSVGASIGPILKTLSNDMRGKKSALVEKKGAEATTKLLFPMMFIILPAIIIILFASMAGNYV